jgi:hypothetical protein
MMLVLRVYLSVHTHVLQTDKAALTGYIVEDSINGGGVPVTVRLKPDHQLFNGECARARCRTPVQCKPIIHA